MDKVTTLYAAREVSNALADALTAVENMGRPETWAEREQRLADGRSSTTGWPVKLLPKQDDGLTIPEPTLSRNRPLNIRNMVLCGTITEGW